MSVKLKFSVVFFVLFCLYSCKTHKKDIKLEEEYYVEAYKTSVLYGCLNEATNGGFQKFSIENNDLGLAVPVAVLFHAETEQAKQRGQELSKKIRAIDY